MWRHSDFDSFSPTVCAKLLEEFHSTTAMYTEPDDEYFQMCCSVVETAVQSALAEPEPSPGNVVWTYVFATRVIFHDPTLRAVIDAELALEGRPDELDDFIEDLLYQQPSFPPACYAFEFK